MFVKLFFVILNKTKNYKQTISNLVSKQQWINQPKHFQDQLQFLWLDKDNTYLTINIFENTDGINEILVTKLIKIGSN